MVLEETIDPGRGGVRGKAVYSPPPGAPPPEKGKIKYVDCIRSSDHLADLRDLSVCNVKAGPGRVA